MARWIAKLQEYNFSLSYEPGTNNAVGLSRVPDFLLTNYTAPLTHERLQEPMEYVSALIFVENFNSFAEQLRQNSVLSVVMTALQCNKKVNSSEGYFLRLRQVWRQLSFSDEGVLIRRFVVMGVPVSVFS